ncbi:unnamed protein product [Brassicogethes aeneus]|uniref:CCHC-type domain-containing protein n=1 Tax=Brassicogethes aeneus TaxID=1431903 RepID=A0A9P0AZN5_BRAAE|nr:unnamed protein product [Brassicogethes aeneus]
MGIPDPEYSHIMSFRRQVYIAPKDNISESLIINHEDTSYRVFLSQDSLSCYKCKKQGHLAINCTSTLSQDITNIPRNNEKLTTQNKPEDQTTSLNNVQSQSVIQDNTLEDELAAIESNILEKNLETSTTSKRSLEQILTPPTTSENFFMNSGNDLFKKPNDSKRKKTKSHKVPQDIEELMKPTKEFIEKGNFILTYNEITDFLENVHGSPDPLS